MWLGRNLISDPGIQHTEVIHLDPLFSPYVTYLSRFIESPIPFPEDMDTDLH